MKSFSDFLRRAMLPWYLRVALIEPGALETSMLDAYDRARRNLSSELFTDVQHALLNATPCFLYRPDGQGKLFFYVLYLSPVCLIDVILNKALNFRPSGVQDQLVN